MWVLCLAGYLITALFIGMLIWSALIAAKKADKDRGYDILEEQELNLAG
jgi:hypothetical protein